MYAQRGSENHCMSSATFGKLGGVNRRQVECPWMFCRRVARTGTHAAVIAVLGVVPACSTRRNSVYVLGESKKQYPSDAYRMWFRPSTLRWNTSGHLLSWGRVCMALRIDVGIRNHAGEPPKDLTQPLGFRLPTLRQTDFGSGAHWSP